ncbi:hypothetical protein C8R44DRAFT_916742 [Mycena epipterygia]|nr:hypothetical protein C8R44DRAFT_916742 [Mycena epipterygia]
MATRKTAIKREYTEEFKFREEIDFFPLSHSHPQVLPAQTAQLGLHKKGYVSSQQAQRNPNARAVDYCGERLCGSSEDVAVHLEDAHAPRYLVSWNEGVENRKTIQLFRDGELVWCPECIEKTSESMAKIAKHMMASHGCIKVAVRAVDAPQLPWPPRNAKDWDEWAVAAGRPTAADRLLSQQTQPNPNLQAAENVALQGRADDAPSPSQRREPEELSVEPMTPVNRSQQRLPATLSPEMRQFLSSPPSLSRPRLQPPRHYEQEHELPRISQRTLSQRQSQPHSSQQSLSRTSYTEDSERPRRSRKQISTGGSLSPRPRKAPLTPSRSPEISSPAKLSSPPEVSSPADGVSGEDVDMTTEPEPLLASNNALTSMRSKRTRSPSPLGGSNKRPKLDAPLPSFISRLRRSTRGIVDVFASPFKRLSVDFDTTPPTTPCPSSRQLPSLQPPQKNTAPPPPLREHNLTSQSKFEVDGSSIMSSHRLGDASHQLHRVLGSGARGTAPLVPFAMQGAPVFFSAANLQNADVPALQRVNMDELLTDFEQGRDRAVSQGAVSLGLPSAPRDLPIRETPLVPLETPALDQVSTTPVPDEISLSRNQPPASALLPLEQFAQTPNADGLGSPLPLVLASRRHITLPQPTNPVFAYNPNAVTLGVAKHIQAGTRAEMAHAIMLRKLRVLERLSNALEGHCAPCWAFTGIFSKKNHTPFTICSWSSGKESRAKSDSGYKALDPKFQESTACSDCWLPLVQRHSGNFYAPTIHPIPGQGECTHPDAFKQIAWCVLKTKNLCAKFMRENGYPFSPGITAEKYGEWLARPKDGMANIGHLACWLAEYHSR